jgi:hypothetical protein
LARHHTDQTEAGSVSPDLETALLDDDIPFVIGEPEF